MQGKTLEEYIDRLRKLKEEKKDNITRDDLKKTALDTGITNKDIEWLEQETGKCLNRGKAYINQKKYHDAKTEFNRATEMSPLNQNVMVETANFYYAMYNHEKRRQFLNAIEHYARKCLEIQPANNQATELLHKVGIIKKKKRQKRAIFVGIVFILLPLLAFIVFYFFREIG